MTDYTDTERLGEYDLGLGLTPALPVEEEEQAQQKAESKGSKKRPKTPESKAVGIGIVSKAVGNAVSQGELFSVKTKDKKRDIGKEDTFVSENTGETIERTFKVVQTVESSTFTKVFAAAMGLSYGKFGVSEHRLLWLLVSMTQFSPPGEFCFVLNLPRVNKIAEICASTYKQEIKPFKKSSFYTARKNLVDAGILIDLSEKENIEGLYAINPDFCFNGQRINVMVEIKKKEIQNLETHTDALKAQLKPYLTHR